MADNFSCFIRIVHGVLISYKAGRRRNGLYDRVRAAVIRFACHQKMVTIIDLCWIIYPFTITGNSAISFSRFFLLVQPWPAAAHGKSIVVGDSW